METEDTTITEPLTTAEKIERLAAGLILGLTIGGFIGLAAGMFQVSHELLWTTWDQFLLGRTFFQSMGANDQQSLLLAWELSLSILGLLVGGFVAMVIFADATEEIDLYRVSGAQLKYT